MKIQVKFKNGEIPIEVPNVKKLIFTGKHFKVWTASSNAKWTWDNIEFVRAE